MINRDRSTGVLLLRQLRERRGWSWSDLARALSDTARRLGVTSLAHVHRTSIQRTIARWESPSDDTAPGERYQFLLAHIYARTSVGVLALGPGSEFDGLLTALHKLGVSDQRLRQLRALATQTVTEEGGLGSLLSYSSHAGLDQSLREPTRLNAELLNGLDHAVTDIDQQVGTVPFVRLQLLLAPVVQACRCLTAAEIPASLRNELYLAATNTYLLAGRLAFETRDDAASAAFYAAATDAAEHQPDISRRASMRTSHTMVTLYSTGDLAEAHRIADAAVRDAQHGSSAAVRARAYAVQAEVAARAGQVAQSDAALRRAWKAVTPDATDNPVGGFDARRLAGFEGVCQLHTGKADQAHRLLDCTYTALSQPRDQVQRGIVTTDLALARLRLGDPQSCVALLHESVDIASATGGRVAAQRIRDTRRELTPWRTETFMTHLDDHIHEALIGR